jgi:hypothetical protein
MSIIPLLMKAPCRFFSPRKLGLFFMLVCLKGIMGLCQDSVFQKKMI